MKLDKRDFTGWPSRNNKPVLRLCFEPNEITEHFGLTFINERDDLDNFLASHFFIEGIGFVVLMRHENAPQSGTPVYVDSSVKSADAINAVINHLELSDNDINWRVTD